MPFTIPPNVEYALLAAKYYLRNVDNRVFGFDMYYVQQGAGTPTLENVTDWANTVFQDVGGQLRDLLDQETYVANVVATWYQVGGAHAVLQGYSVDAALAGLRGTLVEDADLEEESLPPSASLVLRKITGYGGRQNQGRIFVPFISEAVQHDGKLDTNNISTARDVCAELMAPPTLAGQTLKPAHWNRKDNTMVEILQLRPMQFLGTRRDRRIKERNQPL